MRLHVEYCVGHEGEETPHRLAFDSRAVKVTNVVDRWLGRDHRYFKVMGEDGATYILRHDMLSGGWELVMFDSGRGRETEP
jgi:hypothetical protein